LWWWAKEEEEEETTWVEIMMARAM